MIIKMGSRKELELESLICILLVIPIKLTLKMRNLCQLMSSKTQIQSVKANRIWIILINKNNKHQRIKLRLQKERIPIEIYLEILLKNKQEVNLFKKKIAKTNQAYSKICKSSKYKHNLCSRTAHKSKKTRLLVLQSKILLLLLHKPITTNNLL